MKKTLKYLAWACVIAALSAPVALADEDKAVNDDASIVRSLDIFNTLYKELNTFYVDTINAQKSIENAINAMLEDIDPYTEYIPAKETDEFMTLSTGEYGGIGSYLMERTVNGKKGVYISGPYEGSPAARAGLRSGDRIIMIDGDSTSTWTSDQVEFLQGEAEEEKGETADSGSILSEDDPFLETDLPVTQLAEEKAGEEPGAGSPVKSSGETDPDA